MSMQNLVKTCLTLASLCFAAAPLAAAPVNDAFTNRIALRGLVVTTVGSNTDATRELGEPDHVLGTGDRSVWWSWTAPFTADGLVSITTSNSSFDTLLAVYTGTALSNLTLVSNNDDATGIWPQSGVEFTAVAGTVYQIAVDGFGRPNSASGNIQLNIAGSTTATPIIPPIVQVVQPANHAILPLGNISLVADAYDNDGAITNVAFYQGTTEVGHDTLHPYSVTLNDATVGDYQFRAVAWDSSGMVTTSAVVQVSVVVNPPPLVSLTSPTNTQAFQVPLNLALTASATDSDGIAGVWFFSGTNQLGFDTNSPYTMVWSNVLAGNYALRALAMDSLGAIGTSAVVNITATGNYPPTVQMTNPPNQSAYSVPASLVLGAQASDLDGTIDKVEFYEGDSRLAELLSAPFTFAWNNVTTGEYVLTAVATDNGGLTATSPPISITVTQQVFTMTNTLVAAGSDWKYLDDGSNQGTAWAVASFDDSGWLSGLAQLGYSNGEENDEATLLNYGPDPNNKYITYYFRHAFSVTNASSYTNLSLQLLVDDGGVVYLNGQEVLRYNLPDSTIGYQTLALQVEFGRRRCLRRAGSVAAG